MEQRSRETSPRDLLYVFFRHKRKMAILFVVVATAVAVDTFRRPEIYRSEAKLLVRVGRETVSLDPTATIGETINVTRPYEREINSELEILRSRDLADAVVDAVGLDAFRRRPDAMSADRHEAGNVESLARRVLSAIRNITASSKALVHNVLVQLDLRDSLSERERAIRRVVENLEIATSKETNVITMAYEAESPHLAGRVLDKFIDAYLGKHATAYQTPGTQRFFEQQSEHLRVELDAAEEELQSVKNESGIASLEQQRQAVVTNIGALEQRVAEAEAERAASQAKLEALKKRLSGMPQIVVLQETTGLQDYGADLMRSALYALQLKEQDLISNFTEDSEQVQRIRMQVAEAKGMLRREEEDKPSRAQVVRGVNVSYQQTQLSLLAEEANLSALQSEILELRSQLDGARAGLKLLNDVEIKGTRLQREISLLAESYQQYCQKLEETRIDQALRNERISNISIVQAATVPTSPVRPRKGLMLALGLLLALFGAMVVGFGCEYLDHSVKTPGDVEAKLGLTVLASIPRLRLGRSFPIRSLSKHAQPGEQEATQAVDWCAPRGLTEPYETFREQPLFSSNGTGARRTGARVFAVVGCRQGEGVSSVTANLAASLARSGAGPVLVVDANICGPSMHRIFGTRFSPGLVDLVGSTNGRRKLAISHLTPDLHVLTTGTNNGAARELFNAGSDRLAKAIGEMRKPYRFILVDMPATSDMSSTARIASTCDGVILVVEAERLRWEVVQREKEQLEKWRANIVGVVLNKRRYPIPGWLYRAL
ncbi:MAG: hypothetical protein A2Y76_01390 [Planctomycetes bacterium RBG_13_60_9]|nr:MAG: hypothetical protein A2Y76_01390 [Planctomycetes bacterium RBG_13_60_9]